MAGPVCNRCGRELDPAAYELRAGDERIMRCLRCALIYPPFARRSLAICLLIGTVLTAINQGNLVFRGDFPAALAWKIPLTYAVPYIVATTGAILNARTRVRARGHPTD